MVPQELKPLNISIRRGAEKEFKDLAKRAFPKETFAYLLGHYFENKAFIDEIFAPPDVNNFTTKDAVHVQDHWLSLAKKEAKAQELNVIGEIHSHPYEYFPGGTSILRAGRILSEADFDRKPFGINGICVVVEQKSKRLLASCRYYPPINPVNIKRVDD